MSSVTSSIFNAFDVKVFTGIFECFTGSGKPDCQLLYGFIGLVLIIGIIIYIVKKRREPFSYVWRSIEGVQDRSVANNLPPLKPSCATPMMAFNSEARLDPYMNFLQGMQSGSKAEQIIYDSPTHPVYVDSNCLNAELLKTNCMSCSVDKCRKIM